MDQYDWVKEFPGSVTVCDTQGIILYMNDRSLAGLEGDVGGTLVGQNLFDCHSADSNHKIKEILRTQQPNIYTIEKYGVRKLIYQVPWYQKGQVAGLVELSLVIPFEMPHFLRG